MLDFYISLETEKNKLMDMFCLQDIGFPMEKRVQQYHFSLDLAKDMYHLPRHQWDKKLEDFLSEAYTKHKDDLASSLSFFQKYWNQHSEQYFGPINQFFGEQIPPYRVLLAHFLDGISNWVEPSIVINAYSYQTPNPLYHTYTLLYEIILSQVFIRTRQIKSAKELTDEDLWMIAELAAFSFLATTFTEFSKVSGTGYPQVDIHALKFRELMNMRPKFEDFITKSFNLIK
ncbi:MAG: hypothetical protein IKS41_06480 [Alphaproteobacteria bacterium]|nr:hypothetical protein [Alphaproteobacteria bacterium]